MKKIILKETIMYLVIILFGFIIMHNIFSPGLMTYSDHIPHFVEANYLKEELIENGKISGWYPYVFAGIPLYTYIPVFGHYLIILLSYLIGISLAYKIIVLFSFVAPSLGIYTLVKRKFNRIIALLVSLPLLFIDGWQGAILTGLWATGIAIFFLLLFINYIFKTKIENSKNIIISGIFLSIIVLSHIIIFMVAVIFLGSYFISNYKNYKKNFLKCSLIVILSILLSSFYLFPIIATSNWTDTPRNTIIGFGNNLKEIIITETGQLFNLKPHLLPLIDIYNLKLKEGIINLLISIVKNFPVLILDILSVIGIILIFKNKLYKDSEIRTLTIYFFVLLFLASNIWLLIPQLEKIKFLNTFAVYPARLIFTARVLLPFFAAIALIKLKNKKTLIIFAFLLLIIPLLLINAYTPVKNLTQTTSSSENYKEAVEVMLWINKTVNPLETRVFDQNTYGNSEKERKSILFASSPLFTKVQFLTSWITRVYHTEEYLTSETGVVGKEKIENINIKDFKKLLEIYNAKYIITSDNKLKEKLKNSSYFKIEKEGNAFTIFSLKNYKPSWINSKEIKYKIVEFDSEKIELEINSSKKQEIEIKIAYHPYWNAKINNQEVKLTETKNALIKVEVPEGSSNLKLEFIAIPKIFAIITIISILTTIIALISLKYKK